MDRNGIVFSLNKQLFITPAEDILEIIQDSSPQHIPLTQPWLLGITQFRGEIIPVTDLERFILQKNLKQASLYNQNINPISRYPIIVFSKDNWLYGIRVISLLGIQSMPNDSNINPIGDLPAEFQILQPVIDGYIKDEKNEGIIYTIRLTELTELTSFMSAQQFIEINN